MNQREIELKLEVPIRALSRLADSALLKGADTSTRKPTRIESVYFDTDDLDLRHRGLSLRVRRIDGRHVQTVKQENDASSPLFARNEWEQDIDAKQPDLEAARDTG